MAVGERNEEAPRQSRTRDVLLCRGVLNFRCAETEGVFVLTDGKHEAVGTLTEEQTLTSPAVPCLSLKPEGIFPPEHEAG